MAKNFPSFAQHRSQMVDALLLARLFGERIGHIADEAFRNDEIGAMIFSPPD